MFDRLLHKYLRVPYRLHLRYDSKSGKETVVLLHGIAASGEVWHATYQLLEKKYRVVVIDLLGFGDSPKPDFVNYTASDHAKSINYTLSLLGIRTSYIVGHSMGAIIALHYARVYPRRVHGLICVSMPTYDMSQGRKKALLRYRTNTYVAIYKAMIDHPDLTWSATQSIIRRFGSKTGLLLDKPSVVPFQRSLMNTIIRQHALEELREVTVPTVVLYGSLDPFIIQNYYQDSYVANKQVTFVRVGAAHVLEGALVDGVKLQLDRMSGA